MSTPTVSVALAVRNAERTVRESLQSVLNQTWTDFDVIVVDDGSTDRTPELLDRMAASDARVRVIRREHRGLAPSLNGAIELARGKYVARQDADDVSMPSRLDRQVRFLDTHPAVCAVGTAGVVIDDAGRAIRAYATRHGAAAVRKGLRTLRGSPIHGSMMMRRQAVVDVGGYRGAFSASQDADLWLRLCERGDIDNVPEPLYHWRIAAGSVYADHRARQLRYAALARVFASERARYGDDSYAALVRSGGDLDAFAATYRMGPALRALWGELLLRNGDSRAAFGHFHAAVAAGDRRPRTLAGWVWTAAGLRWPGRGPLRVPLH